jgi:NodT family efflux transporter outer membrane factor (OMF) lipoprotein
MSDRMRLAGLGALAMLACLAVLQGCTLKPAPSGDEVRSKALLHAPVPRQWSESGGDPAGVEPGWLHRFGDPQLEAFIAEALGYNPDLQMAAARVEQAAAYVKVAGGKLYPAIGVIGRGGKHLSGDESGLQGIIVGVSWELDLWGRVRYGVRASKEQLAATEADYQFASQSLAALVAKSWFLASEAALQRDFAVSTVQSANELLQIAQQRALIGIGSELDVASASASLQSYRDALIQLDLAEDESSRALELLLGRYPAAEISAVHDLPALADSVPVGLPSELLERRPDVIAAEHRVAVAFSRVQEARAARLPAISLSAGGSAISSDLYVLKDRGNPVWSAGGKILAPIFTGGALKGQVEVATAEQQQAISAYTQTALTAFSDVESALANETVLQGREFVLGAGVTDANRALQLALTRYRVGSVDLRYVQQEQLALYAAQVSLLHVQAERRVQRVNLYLALGGDFLSGT